MFYAWFNIWNQGNLMNWLLNILEEIKWKAQDFVWAIQDKIALNKELKNIDESWDEVEEIEVKPKKKKTKKKTKNK